MWRNIKTVEDQKWLIFSGCGVVMEECQLLEPKGDALQGAGKQEDDHYKNRIESVFTKVEDNKFETGGRHWRKKRDWQTRIWSGCRCITNNKPQRKGNEDYLYQQEHRKAQSGGMTRRRRWKSRDPNRWENCNRKWIAEAHKRDQTIEIGKNSNDEAREVRRDC